MADSSRKKQSFLKGTLILSIAAVIVKVIGAVFKIPLMNILGGDGMGYFSTAYDLYMPVYVLSTAGLPVAIARVVAEFSSQHRFQDVKKTLKVANRTFFVTGFIGFCIMFFGAKFFVTTIENPGAYLAVLAMAPTVFFVCLTSAYRGYYQGLQNMYPTAISQVVESLLKLVLGLGLSLLVYNAGMNGFDASGAVFGKHAADFEAARLIALQYASAAAILSVAIGSFGSALSTWLYYRFKGDRISKEELSAPQETISANAIFKKVVKIAVPIALGSMVGQVTGLIDLWSVLNRLGHAVETNYGAIAEMYGSAIPVGKTLESIPNYLNGCYKGMAVTLYNLIPTFTVAMGVSALPAVTVAWETKDLPALKQNIESVLRVTLLFVLPAGLGMSALSQPILTLLYGGRPDEVIIATPLLAYLGLAVIFAAACSPINSMLQAVGRADLPVKIMVVCASLKLIINYILVGIPEINIRGAAIGTLICYVLIMTISLFFLFRIANIRPNFKTTFIRPTLSAVICAAAAYGAYELFHIVLPGNLSTILAIGVAAVVYVVCLVLLRAITEDDIKMLPKGEKLAQLYRKLPGIK
ncbi:MAG: polysaccharide biosynthesis protein [Oscillospiraceae bacterium]|nr:polysaccharide biosynthesis protein [Oscillospiraceae bacterium]